MYFIRIDNLDELKLESDITDVLTKDINDALAEKGLVCGGIHRFPGKQDLFVMIDIEAIEPRIRAGKRQKDKLLGFEDWVFVNDVVNDTLDKYGIYGVVKSTKYVVRVGKRRRQTYEGGRALT
jgi:hypothetical protein